MSIRVDATGVADALDKLRLADSQIDEAAIKAINQSAREVRSSVLAKEIESGTGFPMALAIQRFRLSTAKKRHLEATLTPSSLADDARLFDLRTGRVDATGTRAQIIVRWFGGSKVAPGFINPKGAKQAPLRSRNHKGPLKQPRPALGLSVAAMYKAFFEDNHLETVRETLIERFIEQLQSKA